MDDWTTEALLMVAAPDMKTFCIGFCQDYWQRLTGWKKVKGFFHCFACLYRWGIVCKFEGLPPKYNPGLLSVAVSEDVPEPPPDPHA